MYTCNGVFVNINCRILTNRYHQNVCQSSRLTRLTKFIITYIRTYDFYIFIRIYCMFRIRQWNIGTKFREISEENKWDITQPITSLRPPAILFLQFNEWKMKIFIHVPHSILIYVFFYKNLMTFLANFIYCYSVTFFAFCFIYIYLGP